MTTITVYGLFTDKKIQAIKCLRAIGHFVAPYSDMHLGLKDAKELADNVDKGIPFTIDVPDQAEAMVRCALRAHGFNLDSFPPVSLNSKLTAKPKPL